MFRAAAGGGGTLTFARFMELALYHPATGYYRRDRPRVGRRRDADFYTATSLGTVFGELVAADIAKQPWRGLFVAFDYGKSLDDLTQHTPGGTARAYFRHQMSEDLLSRPGEQDLTCHVCWDWLRDALTRHGFPDPRLEFQETFLVRHALPALAAASEEESRGLSARKLALLQLLHPAGLGQKFQVLHALR